MAHTSTFTLLDASGEKSSVRVYNGAITAVSIGGFLTQFGALRDAINGITLGTVHKEMWVGDDTVLSQALPASPWAQRELKALVRYQGNTSQKVFTLEIPTIDLGTVTLVPGTDLIQLDDGAEMAAFVTAFEAIARTPDDDTETVNVLDARVVGRNL
jgi:hypothetical protein